MTAKRRRCVKFVVVAVFRAGCDRQLDTTERRQHLRPAEACCSDGGRGKCRGKRRPRRHPHRRQAQRLGGRQTTSRQRYTAYSIGLPTCN